MRFYLILRQRLVDGCSPLEASKGNGDVAREERWASQGLPESLLAPSFLPSSMYIPVAGFAWSMPTMVRVRSIPGESLAVARTPRT